MKLRRIHFLLVLLVVAVCAIPFRRQVRKAFVGAVQKVKGKKTVADRLVQFEGPVRTRLQEDFRKTGLEFPPARLTLIGLKLEHVLEVWGQNATEPPRLIKAYPILGASGTLGPKLVEGDGQVPEGLYQVESLNPNSAFHLALRVNYPNAYDRQKGALEQRKELGSDIMIHGSTASIGCLAMGDEVAEELFVLAARTGLSNISVILSPVDFRRRELPAGLEQLPAWSGELYAEIRKAMVQFKSADYGKLIDGFDGLWRI
jgi:L,D-transpeptidase catalytic domain